MISASETITGHLNALIEYLQSGNAEDARMRAHQVLFDLQRLRATVPDRTKGGSGFIIAAVQLGIDVGKIRDLDASIHSVVSFMNKDEIDAALEECEAARESWLATKGE